MGFAKYMPINAALDLPLEANLHRWLKNLDIAFYRDYPHSDGVADLKHLSDSDLTLHFIQRGIIEGRAYNRHILAFFDAKDYIERYPELRLADENEARRHWMYYGVYEDRVPNRMTQDLLDADIHLFQMGKVGSKSIKHALQLAGHRRLIPHLHWASEIVQTYSDSFLSYDEIINRDPHKELIFISGVRDPLERVVSGLFQAASERKSSQNLDELASIFAGPREQIETYLLPHLAPVLDWFSHGYFRGIDVYEHAFDAERGYDCIRKGPVAVFLYRLDAMARCWQPLSELVGVPLLPQSVNESPAKTYGNQLQAALRVVREINDGPLQDLVRSSCYWRHFYSKSASSQPRLLPGTIKSKIIEGQRPLQQAATRAEEDSRPPIALASVTDLAGTWIEVNAVMRSSLSVRPACFVGVNSGRSRVSVDHKVPVRFDGNGRLRILCRLPNGCTQLKIEPQSPQADFALVLLEIHPRSLMDVVLAAVRFEWAAGPVTLARRLWRALRAARMHGWLSVGACFFDHIERNTSGYVLVREFGGRQAAARARS